MSTVNETLAKITSACTQGLIKAKTYRSTAPGLKSLKNNESNSKKLHIVCIAEENFESKPKTKTTRKLNLALKYDRVNVDNLYVKSISLEVLSFI